MAEFVPDPYFQREVSDAAEKALGDLAKFAEVRAKARATWSRSVRRKLYAKKGRSMEGPFMRLSSGGGLQNIAEQPKGVRHTRTGAGRGVMRKFPVIQPTAKEIISRGLDLSRYL
jgi:hypothetical protein